MSDIDLVKKVRVYAEEAEKNGFEVLTVPLRDLFPLLGRMEAAERRVAELENDESRQRLANAEHQLYMKDLAINNIKASRRAQFKKRQAAERERYELRKTLQATQGGAIEAINHAMQLQAEIARRDAAAGEPVMYQIAAKLPGFWKECGKDTYDEYREYHRYLGKGEHFAPVRALYAAAPPAASAPDATFDPAKSGAEATIVTHFVAPEGYKLVPIEPSKEMLLASKRYKAKNKVPTGPGVYRAMIAAAPAPVGDCG